MGMGPESRLVGAIRRSLEARGCCVVKVHGSQYMPEGFPDLVIVLPGGETVYLEVKVPGRTDGPWRNGLAPMQLRWLWKLGELGARVSWAESVEQAVRFVFPSGPRAWGGDRP